MARMNTNVRRLARLYHRRTVAWSWPWPEDLPPLATVLAIRLLRMALARRWPGLATVDFADRPTMVGIHASRRGFTPEILDEFRPAAAELEDLIDGLAAWTSLPTLRTLADFAADCESDTADLLIPRPEVLRSVDRRAVFEALGRFHPRLADRRVVLDARRHHPQLPRRRRRDLETLIERTERRTIRERSLADGRLRWVHLSPVTGGSTSVLLTRILVHPDLRDRLLLSHRTPRWRVRVATVVMLPDGARLAFHAVHGAVCAWGEGTEPILPFDPDVILSLCALLMASGLGDGRTVHPDPEWRWTPWYRRAAEVVLSCLPHERDAQ